MKILIVDDEKLARLNIIRQLDDSISVQEATSFEDGLRKIRSQSFDLCYIDLKLDASKDLLGLNLIPEAVARGIYTVVMTSVESDEVLEQAYELGCQDVYNKGNETEHISETLNRYFMSKEGLLEERLIRDIAPTSNKKYKDSLKKLAKLIPTEVPIVLLGESGTGKSHLARGIHQLSGRKGKFVELNCATFSGDTLKSELFGHAKGSFTGAVSENSGKLAEAHNGTLFLDEIGAMSLEMQEALLKVLEEKAFYPLGSNKQTRSDFRIICATLDDLEVLIKSGKFRFDLFQRISGFTFIQPALRQRKEDIFSLLRNKLNGARKIIFKEEAKVALEAHNWPGNIRELMRLAEILTHSGVGVVRRHDVEEFIQSRQFGQETQCLEDHQYSLIREMGLRNFIEKISREAVERALAENDNQARKAISELGISSATFYRLLRTEEKIHPALKLAEHEVPNELH